MKDRKPDIKVFFTNLKSSIPWYEKIYKLFRNNFKKIITLKNCCGNLGEPGC